MSKITQKIASKLKALRKEKSWSLDKTSEATGVSKAMLGQIEREESSPTVATLWKIATGFQVPFSSFLEEMDVNQDKPGAHSGKVKKLHRQDTIRMTPIFPFDLKVGFEIFLIELPPGAEHLSLPHKSGVIEHVMVVDGVIEIFSKARWKKLKKGEGIRFAGDQKHGYRNSTQETACFHNIIYYPKRKK